MASLIAARKACTIVTVPGSSSTKAPPPYDTKMPERTKCTRRLGGAAYLTEDAPPFVTIDSATRRKSAVGASATTSGVERFGVRVVAHQRAAYRGAAVGASAATSGLARSAGLPGTFNAAALRPRSARRWRRLAWLSPWHSCLHSDRVGVGQDGHRWAVDR